KNNVEYLAEEEVPLMTLEEELAHNTAIRLATIRGYMLYGDGDYLHIFETFNKEATTYQNKILELTDSEEVIQLIENNDKWTENIYDNVIAEYDEGNKQVAINNLEELNEVSDNILNSLSDLSTARQELFQETSNTLVKNGQA